MTIQEATAHLLDNAARVNFTHIFDQYLLYCENGMIELYKFKVNSISKADLIKWED